MRWRNFFIITLVFLFFFPSVKGQNTFKDKYIVYPNFQFGVGFPQQNLQNYVDPWRFVFNIDALISGRDHPASLLETGLHFGLVSIGSKIDKVDGLEITTSSEMIDLSYIIGFKIPITRSFKLRPNFAIGINFATTSSSYEIVDEATFFERFTGFQEEDLVQEVQVNNFNDNDGIYGFGFGVIYKEIFFVDFRVLRGGIIRFVDKKSIYVEDSEILYAPQESSVNFFTVGLGFSLIKLMDLAVENN